MTSLLISRLARVLLAAGVLALACAAFVAIDAWVYQRQMRVQLAQPAPSGLAVPVPLADGEPIGRILIPRLGIAVVFVQGESDAILRRAVGHLTDTALPGVTGNVVLAGHRDTFFRPLKDVRVGDAITITTRAGAFSYVVESAFVVTPADVHVLDATGGRTLTLITCFPFYYVGPAPDRFIVRAREVAAGI